MKNKEFRGYRVYNVVVLFKDGSHVVKEGFEANNENEVLRMVTGVASETRRKVSSVSIVEME